MTEKEWRSCKNPFGMLHFLRWKVSARKLRLFAVACCRYHWDLFVDQRARSAVEVAELFADGLATENERAAAQAACEYCINTSPDLPIRCLFRAAATIVARNVPAEEADFVTKIGPTGVVAALAIIYVLWAEDLRRLARRRVSRGRAHSERSSRSLKRSFRDLAECATPLRDILGYPFRPVTIDPAWLAWHGGLLGSMAQQMYDARDFAEMPVLADALEEAGCDNADILNHCRQPGEHVRGCWVVDLLLNKS